MATPRDRATVTIERSECDVLDRFAEKLAQRAGVPVTRAAALRVVIRRLSGLDEAAAAALSSESAA